MKSAAVRAKEDEVARQLNSLRDINDNMRNIAPEEHLLEVIAEYFTNREVSDSESELESSDDDGSAENGEMHVNIHVNEPQALDAPGDGAELAQDEPEGRF